jgi:hypothetical protein
MFRGFAAMWLREPGFAGPARLWCASWASEVSCPLAVTSARCRPSALEILVLSVEATPLEVGRLRNTTVK